MTKMCMQQTAPVFFADFSLVLPGSWWSWCEFDASCASGALGLMHCSAMWRGSAGAPQHLELLWTAQRSVWVPAWGIVGGAWIRRHLESCEETRGLWSHIRKRMDEYEEYSNCLGLSENLGAFWDSDSIFKLILTQWSWLPRSNDGVSMKIPTLDDAWLPPAWTRWSWSRRAQTRSYKEQIGLWAFQCTSYNSARHTGAREAEIWWAKLFERFVSANHGYHVDTNFTYM